MLEDWGVGGRETQNWSLTNYKHDAESRRMRRVERDGDDRRLCTTMPGKKPDRRSTTAVQVHVTLVICG